jgi:hypothetical protein
MHAHYIGLVIELHFADNVDVTLGDITVGGINSETGDRTNASQTLAQDTLQFAGGDVMSFQKNALKID